MDLRVLDIGVARLDMVGEIHRAGPRLPVVGRDDLPEGCIEHGSGGALPSGGTMRRMRGERRSV